MRITARTPTQLPTDTQIEPGGAMKIEGFDFIAGTITRIEVVEEDGRRFLEVEAVVDEASRAAQVFYGRRGS